MRQVGQAMWIYANNDLHEYYPPISKEPGLLAASIDVTTHLQAVLNPPEGTSYYIVAPSKEFIEEAGWSTETIFQNIFTDKDYFYLAYAVSDDSDVETFANAYRESVAEGIRMNDDIPPMLETFDPVSNVRYRRMLLYRMRIGIERGFILRFGFGMSNPGADLRSQARLPILIERIGNHSEPGGHVLYLDGHVEFIEYPGKWPMTEKTMRILNELDALGGTSSAR